MALFSINRYSADFFWNDLLQGDRLPEPLREAARSFLSSKFDVEVQSVGNRREIEYSDILVNYHNPLSLNKLLARYGLKLVKIHYYHFHAAPPHLEKAHKEQFWKESLKLERGDDWRAPFLCSAYVAEIVRQ